jgi:hypothetical protein
MNDKKKIERLFQEKFKDFEVNPSPEVWENIASQLEKKKGKKRIFPFWFNAKAAGIAAALVLGFFTLNNNADWMNWNGFSTNTEESQNNQSVAEKNNETVNGKEITPTNTVNPLSNESNSSVASTSEENQIQSKTNASQDAIVSSSENNQLPSGQFSSGTTIVKKNTSNKRTTPYLENNESVALTTIAQKEKKSANSSNQKPNTSLVTNQDVQKNTINDNPVASQTIKESIVVDNNSISTNNNQSLTNSAQGSNSLAAQNKNTQKNTIDKNGNASDENQIAVITNDEKTKSVNKEESVAAVSNQNSNSSITVNQKNEGNSNDKKLTVSDNNQIAENSVDKKTKSANQNQSVATNTDKDYNQSTAVNQSQNKNELVQNSLASKITEEIKYSESNEIIKDSKNTAIANQLTAEQKDSVMVAKVEENPLEKILKEKEKATVEKEKKEEELLTSKWGVRPTIAAIFSGASKGSPISNEFADNSKTFDPKFGLGIGVDYEASKKLTLRSGVNKIDLAYNTDDIAFYTALSGRTTSHNNTSNINKNAASANIVIEDRSNVTTIEIAAFDKESGLLNQQIGYIEVPMEMSYKIVDKKFGLNFITGISTLFLSDNKVSIIRDGMTTEIGEANNLNKVHFSANLGIGMKYNILKSLEASFEPTFKYQVNTFSNDSGNFKPYVIGLYTGFRYKF